MKLEEIIAAEIMDTIERERRINKDDLIIATEVAIGKYQKARVLPFIEPTNESMQGILTQQAMTDAVKEYMRLDSREGGATLVSTNDGSVVITTPGAVHFVWQADNEFAGFASGAEARDAAASAKAATHPMNGPKLMMGQRRGSDGTIAKPGCIPSAEAAEKAGEYPKAPADYKPMFNSETQIGRAARDAYKQLARDTLKAGEAPRYPGLDLPYPRLRVSDLLEERKSVLGPSSPEKAKAGWGGLAWDAEKQQWVRG